MIELIIALGILSILGAIGIKQYAGYVDSAKVSVVKNNLRTIYMQQQEYYRSNNAYYSSGASCSDTTTAINTNLFNGQNTLVNDGFYYCITQATVDDFSARGVEQSGSRTFTINNLNVTNF